MAKFRWNGALPAAGDDAPEQTKRNWVIDQELPPPPREVYDLMHRATACGFFLKWARSPRVLSLWRSRYKLTRAGSIATVYASDNLSDIEAFVAELEAS